MGNERGKRCRRECASSKQKIGRRSRTTPFLFSLANQSLQSILAKFASLSANLFLLNGGSNERQFRPATAFSCLPFERIDQRFLLHFFLPLEAKLSSWLSSAPARARSLSRPKVLLLLRPAGMASSSALAPPRPRQARLFDALNAYNPLASSYSGGDTHGAFREDLGRHFAFD